MSKARMIDAVERLDVPAVKRLLAAKPDLIHVTDRKERNLLHLACSQPGAGSLRMADFLLGAGLEIEAPVGPDRCTPLFFAVARARNPRLVKFLIERGASPSNAPGGGLFAAVWWDDTRSLDLLLRAGAKIDVVVGVTPFLAAWLWKHFRSAKFLAVHGANVNFQDKKGKTALHHGVEKEFDPRLLKWLVQHGASPDIADNQGVSPRLRASRKRDKSFFRAMA